MTKSKEEKEAIDLGSTVVQVTEKLKAGYSGLFLRTSEYHRAQEEIRSALKKVKDAKHYHWILGVGLGKVGTDGSPGKAQEDTDSPSGALQNMLALPSGAVVTMPLMHHFLTDPGIQSLIIQVTAQFKASNRSMIIIAPIVSLPPEIEKLFSVVDMRLPGKEELLSTLKGIVTGSSLKGDQVPDAEMEKHLLEAALGMTTTEAENALTLSFVRCHELKSEKKWDPAVVLAEKCETLRKTGLLTYFPPNGQGMSQIGGLDNLKEWVSLRRTAFTEEAKEYGLKHPKGILTVGPPGSGKSVGARAISAELGLPLIRCDMGSIFAGLVGASEENARRVIQTAEAVAPCVLWLDEIEKGFAGAGGSGNLDSGVGSRVLGTFLTWMQEKTAPVFVYATANNVSALPPELLRKGRFDETFSVTLPTSSERKEIIEIHLKKNKRDAILKDKTFDMDSLISKSEGFSGAEIEQAIHDALFASFSDGKRQLRSFDIGVALDSTTPLSKMMKDQIDAINRWCEGRTRPASRPEASKKESAGRSLNVS